MIDSHHHLWTYTSPDFDWLKPAQRKSFHHTELVQTLAPTQITGTITVQARCCLGENTFLTEQATQTNLIKGIVGWADLTADNAQEILTDLATQPLIKGIREIIQGSPDDKFLSNTTFNKNITTLTKHNLTYDLLIFADQLETANTFVQNHPNLPIVLDHCAKPPIHKTQFPEHWKKGIQKLAENPNLHCKLSGLATEIQDNSPITPDLLEPYVQTILEAFTPDRIMFGSDWPVSLSATTYEEYLKTTEILLNQLSPDEQTKILTINAQNFYNL